ncbi:E3 SUMO-protein ligase EGR2 [Platysternon megacephalum]|uniref:E3 SUMO-protein ligase EGR2 n=1 Tax=Platysternon megacephalum TaxID=55544 RepID=A0A4D9F1M0_9SAUR|nr:E3 SUMO-protein ligase EGR2 [Platysternon megacephalum]
MLRLWLLLTGLVGPARGAWPGPEAARPGPEAACGPEGCYVVFFQRRSFLESWRSCRERGGNLATLKRHEEAAQVAELLQATGPGTGQRRLFWIGLQRQPRQCFPQRPLRGFTWTTGDQDTLYTNWAQAEPAGGTACSASRCVVLSYGPATQENFQWLEGSCTLPVDGFLCHFGFAGMCHGLATEETGPVSYTTPFGQVSSTLSHIPFGTVASVACGSAAPVSVLCMQQDDGSVGWSKEEPLCGEEPGDWCEGDNGGCQQLCVDEGPSYSCECHAGHALLPDGRSCAPADGCQNHPCQFECVPGEDGGYRCLCPVGYTLASNGHACEDTDECATGPCEQLCDNFPGGFQCRCQLGYEDDGAGGCADLDECSTAPCEHQCENTEGSYLCLCHLGFSPAEEAPQHCVDNDECQIPGVCQQMCVNYVGGFECYCTEGYELEADGISCAPLADPPALATRQQTFYPHFGEQQEWGAEVLQVLGTDEPFSLTQEFLHPTASRPYLSPAAPHPSTGHSTPRPSTVPAASTTSPPIPSTTTGPPEPTTGPPIPSTTTGPPDPTTSPPIPSTTTLSPPTFTAPPEPTDAPPVSHTSPAIAPTIGPPTPSTSPPSSRSPRSPGAPASPYSGDEGNPAADRARALLPPSEDPSTSPGGERARRKRDDRWLLVALLVPLCVFLVIMVALGIVYCTRCGARAKSRSVTQCYRWVTSAGGKGPPHPPAGAHLTTCRTSV